MKCTCILCLVTNIVVGCAIFQAQQPEQKKASEHEQPEQTTANPRKTKQPVRKPVFQDLSGFDLLPSGTQSKQHTALAATRGAPAPEALAPRLGKLYSPNPTFAWSYQGKARDFVFVMCDDVQREIYRAVVRSSTFRYPEDAPALKAEKTYFWTVEFSSPVFGLIQSARVGFIVVSLGLHKEIETALSKITRNDPYEAGLSRARVFIDYRLWYDALGAYSDLLARFADRAELYEGRGMIYAQLAVTQKLAEQDFAKAEELGSKR